MFLRTSGTMPYIRQGKKEGGVSDYSPDVRKGGGGGHEMHTVCNRGGGGV